MTNLKFHSSMFHSNILIHRCLGVQDLVAVHPILKDEEITLCYLPSASTGSEVLELRKGYTRKWYGFNCSCRACTRQVRWAFEIKIRFSKCYKFYQSRIDISYKETIFVILGILGWRFKMWRVIARKSSDLSIAPLRRIVADRNWRISRWTS